jgi:hypothetical protein
MGLSSVCEPVHGLPTSVLFIYAARMGKIGRTGGMHQVQFSLGIDGAQIERTAVARG